MTIQTCLNHIVLYTILLFTCNFITAQLSYQTYRSINNEILKLDGSYPETTVLEPLIFEKNGKYFKTEIITWENDDVKQLKEYNSLGSLISIKNIKNDSVINNIVYTYNESGDVLESERGRKNLNYTLIKNTQYVKEYFAVKALEFHKNDPSLWLKDTLFIEKTMFSTQEIFKVQRRHKPPITKDIEKYDRWGYLKRSRRYNNNILTGHFEVEYDRDERVLRQESFPYYTWFMESSGFSLLGNQFRVIEYENELIKTITNEFYDPELRQWIKTVTVFECSINKKNSELTILSCLCDDGDQILMKFDTYGNWIYKSYPKGTKLYEVSRKITYFK